jgi:serine protease Do
VVGALQQGRKPDFGFLGIAPEPNDLALRQHGIWGARIVEVYPGTPAYDAGMRAGDLIVQIDGQPVFDHHDMIRVVGARAPESVVDVRVVRKNLTNRLLSDGISRASQIDVRLSKKYVAGPGPQIGADSINMWRGLRVDYVTATPHFREIVERIGSSRCIVVQEVEADSAAWRAGVRAGDLVSHVGDQEVGSPGDFIQAISARSGVVTLRVVVDRDSTEGRSVSGVD